MGMVATPLPSSWSGMEFHPLLVFSRWSFGRSFRFDHRLSSPKTQGFYLAIATMALGTAVTDVIKRMEILGSWQGSHQRPSRHIFGYHQQWICKVLSLIWLSCTNHLFGEQPAQKQDSMAFRAMRDSEVAAKVFGINISYYKVLAFVISSFLAASLVPCMVILFHICTQTCSDLACPLSFLLLPSIGGIGTCGALCSVRPVGHCPQTFGTKLEAMAGVLFGVILILVVLFLPRDSLSL